MATLVVGPFYVIAGRVEPVLRYGFLMPTGGGDEQHELTGGLNVYFHGHALALQGFATARFQQRRDAPDVRVQAQLGVAL